MSELQVPWSKHQTGYGVVMPELEELSLEPPEIMKQGGRYGVKLCASADSIHLMKAQIKASITPIVGTEKQSEELLDYLMSQFEGAPEKIWQTNIFRKAAVSIDWRRIVWKAGARGSLPVRPWNVSSMRVQGD